MPGLTPLLRHSYGVAVGGFSLMVKFLWDKDNIAHIERHNVLPREAEQAILNRPIDLTRELRSGEVRIRQLGITDAGRILILVSTMVGERIRVVTAHDASRRLRAYYLTIRR